MCLNTRVAVSNTVSGVSNTRVAVSNTVLGVSETVPGVSNTRVAVFNTGRRGSDRVDHAVAEARSFRQGALVAWCRVQGSRFMVQRVVVQ